MGIKNPKGTVSIENYRSRLRLRWRYQGKRYSLNLSHYSKANLVKAKKVASEIEQDILQEQFDFSLKKYNGKSEEPIHKEEKTIVQYFEEWTVNYRQMSCEVNSDYYSLRNALKAWGQVDEKNILGKLNSQMYSPRTYNGRLSILRSFAGWLVKQEIWSINTLDDVSSKRAKKKANKARKPFTENDIKRILEAIQNDTYNPKSSRYSHSHYYPFVYFIFKTGVRNAEAIGLRVGSLDFVAKTVCIKEVMARTVNGTHAAARIRKETKNGKVRKLPLTEDLEGVLKKCCESKQSDDLVFQSFNGKPIDDRMFQRRIFKPVLQELKIEERVLYACRHTFGSRCIDEGMTPVMTAFLMGNNPETALRNYTHQITLPDKLPNI